MWTQRPPQAMAKRRNVELLSSTVISAQRRTQMETADKLQEESYLYQANWLTNMKVMSNYLPHFRDRSRVVSFHNQLLIGTYLGLELNFQRRFISDKPQFPSNRCKNEPFRSKIETNSVVDEFPGDMIGGGSFFFFVVGAHRWGVNWKGSFQRGC